LAEALAAGLLRGGAMKLLTALIGLAPLFAAPARARACGGFFCDRSGQPVVQSGEEILFVADGTHLEVQVRLRYQGSDAGFAWVLPVRKLPTLSLGVDATFLALEQLTVPSFQVRVEQLGCGDYNYGSGGGLGCGAESASANGSAVVDAGPGLFPADAASGVNVVSQGTIGPYESAILQADDGAALFAWLQGNGYLLSPAGAALLDPYVEEHDYFVALKLRADQTSSDITPIILQLDDTEPCIPLRLTAIAAQDDMPITAYFLGAARAVSTNYPEVDLDFAALDLSQPGFAYPPLVSAAVDEAGGRAFVTEFSGSSSILSGALWAPGRFDLSALAQSRDAPAFAAAFAALGMPITAQVIATLRRYLPEPAGVVGLGVSETAFYTCLPCYAQYLTGQIDAASAADELQQRILDPLAAAQARFDALPVLTRLATRISPAEMILDPTFAFNPSLPPLQSQHTATAEMACAGIAGPIRWTLPDGQILKTFGLSWPSLSEFPAAAAWRQLAASGPGTPIADNRDAIAAALRTRNAGIPDPQPVGPDSASGCGCRVLGGRICAFGGMVALASLIALGGRLTAFRRAARSRRPRR
jgi:hypothetical protein